MREGWEYKRLGELCDIVMGQSPMGNSINENNGIEFHQGKTNFGDKFLMESGIYTTSPIRIAEKKTILLCVRAPVGIINITERQVCIGRGLSSLKPRLGLELLYLYYCLLSKQNYFESNSTGSTFKAISSKVINNTIIQFPSKSTQLSIVSELDKLNELIRIKKEQLKDYDTLAQSIFYEMFGDPVENEKGWKVKKLGELCSKIGSGATPRGGNESYKDEGISLIRSLNVYNNEFRRKDLAYIDDEQAAALSNVTILEDDVLLNITGASVARCCIVPSDLLPARVNQHVCIIRPLDNVLVPIFLNKVLTNISYQIRLLALARSKGATREALPKSVVDSLLIPLPPLPLQHSFAQKIEQIEQQKAAIQKTITDLETLLAARIQYWFD
ncbi:restriction endonuclease subunit S [Prevotella sp.]|jgi:type i restriction enzyme ecobi specificity protein (S protein (S.ecobi))|uniref:restriction endonuclease subunit S n=1 Tax=Prevotella sp. TaxID=59823 RepID=UPI001CB01250|nr:restriction endonuclease subunit S [Prevotella sp.]MBF1618644.1 restriction endonuclease subunit S [Prevotella sp.]